MVWCHCIRISIMFKLCKGYSKWFSDKRISAVFPHIPLCGHQSLMSAWLHLKWLNPILRCDRGLFCTSGIDGCVSQLATGCSPPCLLRFPCHPFCRWTSTRLVWGRDTSCNWFISALWFWVWLSGANCISDPKKKLIKRQCMKFIAKSQSADRWSNLTLWLLDRSPENGA